MPDIKDLNKCSEDRWKQAQEWELAVWLGSSKNSEDWNSWWLNKFNNYECLSGRNFYSLFEVGCGPYAKNTEHFLKIFPNVKEVALLDPLLDDYISNGFEVKKIANETNAKTFSSSIEKYNDDKKYDIILCINVLDHVQDADLCMEKMLSALNEKGVLVLGQDLTNEEDFKLYPSTITDIGHPIKLDHFYFKEKLCKKMNHLYHNILPRNEGRNPSAHYGTLIYVGEKLA